MHTARRRTFYATAIVLAWLGFLVEGSHALFMDTASLTGNSITTGSVDLQVSNSQNGSSTLFADSRAGFSFNLNPGESSERYFFLKNASSSSVPLDITATSILQSAGVQLTSALDIEFTPVDSTGAVTGTPTTVKLSALANGAQPINLRVPAGEAQRIKMKLSLSQAYMYTNDSLGFDLVFTGTQHID